MSITNDYKSYQHCINTASMQPTLCSSNNRLTQQQKKRATSLTSVCFDVEKFTSITAITNYRDKAQRMNQRKVNEMSSTPVIKPGRKSLALIGKNTVSGMINRFSQMIESPNEIAERKPPPVGRQASWFTELSAIEDTSDNGIDSKLSSVDDGSYDSFRRRSRSVNNCTAINQPKSVLAKYAAFPNFKFSQLKYFGVDPKEYLSSFGIDYDSVSNSVEVGDGGGDSVGNNNVALEIRKRSQTMNTKKRTFDSTSVKVSDLKYLAVEPIQRDNSAMSMKNGPVKVATSAECTDFVDVFPTKITANRDALLRKSLRTVATQTTEPMLEYVDKTSPERPLEYRRNGVVDTNLKSRIQKSIHSYDNILKAFRNGGSRKKERTSFEAK